MKEVAATRTVWSLGTVSYDRAEVEELWLGTRLETGTRVARRIRKPLPDILLAGLPEPDPSGETCWVLLDEKVAEYELIAEPPQD